MKGARPDYAAEIKRAYSDPRRVCEDLGLTREGPRTFAKQARGLIVRCPVHADRTPSCSVQNRDGVLLWNCMGCGAHGDALDLIAAVRGLSVANDFRGVLVEAATLAGLWQIVDELQGRSPRTARRAPAAAPAPPPVEPAIDAGRFDEIASALLDACPLEPTAPATRYLVGRGFLEEARVAGFGALPPPGPEQDAVVASLVGQFGPSDLALAGLLRDGRLAWPWHLLILPWRSLDGTISTLQRRRVVSDCGPPPYVFPRALRPAEPFGADVFRAAGTDLPVAFVEGALDVLALRTIIRGRSSHVVLGVPGVATWRPTWTEYARGRRVVLAFDADEAGDRAAAARATELRSVASEVRRARPRVGKDWGDQLSGGALERRSA